MSHIGMRILVGMGLLILITASLVGTWAEKWGRTQGHAEQKKWSDAWYAKNPVVKEVHDGFAPMPFVPICRVGEYFQYNAGNETFTCTPAPKPEKRSKRPGHKTEVQPKEYVRPESCKKPETWTAKDCLIISVNPAQPIPEKEPCIPNGLHYVVTQGPAEPAPCKGNQVLLDGKCWTRAITEEYLDLSGQYGKISTRTLPEGVLYQGDNGECPKGYIPNNWASTTFVYAYCDPRPAGVPAGPKP